jgi:plasmid replication initiation protein
MGKCVCIYRRGVVVIINEKNATGQNKSVIESRYSLGETEQKLLLVLISMIQAETATVKNHFYRVSIQKFAQLLGKGESDSLCKEVIYTAKKLKKACVKAILPNGDTVRISWIVGFKYPKNKGWIEFEISSMLESELLHIKDQFTQYYLTNISKLKGGYTMRIYELVRQYVNSNLRSREISLEELRVVLRLRGAYIQPSNLFRRIIQPAHKEINTKTDISFSFRPIKESRKIIAAEFYDIQKKTFIPK